MSLARASSVDRANGLSVKANPGVLDFNWSKGTSLIRHSVWRRPIGSCRALGPPRLRTLLKVSVSARGRHTPACPERRLEPGAAYRGERPRPLPSRPPLPSAGRHRLSAPSLCSPFRSACRDDTGAATWPVSVLPPGLAVVTGVTGHGAMAGSAVGRGPGGSAAGRGGGCGGSATGSAPGPAGRGLEQPHRGETSLPAAGLGLAGLRRALPRGGGACRPSGRTGQERAGWPRRLRPVAVPHKAAAVLVHGDVDLGSSATHQLRLEGEARGGRVWQHCRSLPPPSSSGPARLSLGLCRARPPHQNVWKSLAPGASPTASPLLSSSDRFPGRFPSASPLAVVGRRLSSQLRSWREKMRSSPFRIPTSASSWGQVKAQVSITQCLG